MQMFDIGKELQKAYDEGYVRGVNDFAERLKDVFVTIDGAFECWEVEEHIDELVKEMTEKEGGKG